ncbi:MAG: hypothetical protein QNJ22_16670 [Desulfosarcinaceae bacterium]|nr:hypothetical protein [Desulfosarcinaceae bacterium]
MSVHTPEALSDAIRRDPQASPAAFLADDSFAAWCYDHCSLRALRSAFEGDADPAACRRWSLSPREWRTQIEMAIIALAAARGLTLK